jgi:hypothetical protein
MSSHADPTGIDLRFLRPYDAGRLMRVGRDEDGGYVVPAAAVEGARVLLGIGINDDWSFEEDFAVKNPGVRVVGVDGTAGLPMLYRKALGRALQGIGKGLTLQLGKAAGKFRYWGKIAKFREFFGKHAFLKLMLRARPEAGGVTIAELIERYGGEGDGVDVFLKMDIEGGEYDVLRAAGREMGRVNCLTVEFHDLDRRWEALKEIAAKLEGDFLVAHVHGNNYAPLIAGTNVPSVLEVTWLRRSSSKGAAPCEGPWPLKDLDRPCKPGAEDYVLDFG